MVTFLVTHIKGTRLRFIEGNKNNLNIYFAQLRQRQEERDVRNIYIKIIRDTFCET